MWAGREKCFQSREGAADMEEDSMKKTIKVLFILAILYLTFYVGLKLAGNQGMMLDRFAMNHREFPWIDRTGVWIVVIVPFVMGVIGLVLVGIQMYDSNRSYALAEKCYTVLFAFSTVLCVAIAARVYSHQKPYAEVLRCIGDTISLGELESAGNKSGEQILYIMRKGSVESAEVTSELYHVLLDTGLRLRSYDTASDKEKHPGRLNKILDKYSVTQVPALVSLQDGAVAERFEGADIIDGIVSYAED